MSKKTGTKKKQTKHKEKQQGFNDLLIPMLLILVLGWGCDYGSVQLLPLLFF